MGPPLLHFVPSGVRRMDKSQETTSRRSEHDLGMWEVSFLDAGEGGGTQGSGTTGFGNVERGAPLQHGSSVMRFGEEAGVINVALRLSWQG